MPLHSLSVHSASDLFGQRAFMRMWAARLFTLVAGHVADRVHRGRIIAASLVAQAAVALLLVAATQGLAHAGTSSSWVSRELLLGASVVLGVAPRCRRSRPSPPCWCHPPCCRAPWPSVRPACRRP